MALRLYTKAEFEAELHDRLGLTSTDTVTGTARLWKNKAGKHVTVPMNGVSVPELGERYPDDWMALIDRELERLS
jgi:hypothetical protein